MGDKIINLVRRVINFQHISNKNRKKVIYVNKKRNESNISDNFIEGEYWNISFQPSDLHFISPVKSCSRSQTSNIWHFSKNKGTEAAIRGVLWKRCSFTKLTGKHLCHSLFSSNVLGLRPATSFKKRLWHRCFPVNLGNF